MKFNRVIAWLCVALGVVIPWATGAAMKIHLMGRGEPTFPWGWFFRPGFIPLELWATFWFALPFATLGFVARYDLLSQVPFLRWTTVWERRVVVLGGLAWGSVATVLVFWRIFRQFEPMMLFVAFYTVLAYLDDILLGLVGGLGVVGVARAVRRAGARSAG